MSSPEGYPPAGAPALSPGGRSDEWLTFLRHKQRTAHSAYRSLTLAASRGAPLTPTPPRRASLSREGRGRWWVRAAAHTYLLALPAEQHPQTAQAEESQGRRLGGGRAEHVEFAVYGYIEIHAMNREPERADPRSQ